MTGAVKNQFGCVPGFLKGEFHTKLPTEEHFAQMLVDLNRLIAPRLAVMDAVVGMEGNGPRNGDPRQVGVLLLSADPVAVDALGCRIMALDASLVHTCVWGERWGLGTMTDIELVGDQLPVFEDYVVNRDPASTTRGGSALGKRLLAPRPYIIEERCTRCGTCVKVCPVEPKGVEYPGEDRAQVPVHRYERCIRCYCCQELCPERAIEVKTPLLGRLIRR
jgi:ferredoxin